MKFPMMFTRSKGGGTFPVLGSDPDPLAGTFSPGDVNVGNLFRTRLMGMAGAVMDKVIVGYKGPPGAIALNLEIYVWEETSMKWFLMAPATTVSPDTFAFVPIPNPLSAAPKALQDGNVVGVGDFFIRVLDPGGAPVGDHVLVVAGNES